MLTQVRDPEWLRVGDQQAEDASSAWQVTDAAARFVVQAPGDEIAQSMATFVAHAKRGIAGPGQLAGNGQQPFENGGELAFGDDRTPRVDQPPQPRRVEIDFSPSQGPFSLSAPDAQ